MKFFRSIAAYLAYVFLSGLSSLATPYLVDKLFAGQMYLYGALVSLGNMLRIPFRFISARLIASIGISSTLVLVILFASLTRVLLWLAYEWGDTLGIMIFALSIIIAAAYRAAQGYVVPIALRKRRYFKTFWFFTLSSLESMLIALAPLIASLVLVPTLGRIDLLFPLTAIALLTLLVPAWKIEGDVTTAREKTSVRELLRVEKPPKDLLPLILVVGIDVFAWSTFLPYLYVYLVSRGFSVNSVALSMASFYAPSVLLPLIGRLLDRIHGDQARLYIALLACIQVLGVLGLAVLEFQPQVYIMTFVFIGFATTITSPLMQSLLNTLTKEKGVEVYANILAWWRNISTIAGFAGSVAGGILFSRQTIYLKTCIVLLVIVFIIYATLLYIEYKIF